MTRFGSKTSTAAPTGPTLRGRVSVLDNDPAWKTFTTIVSVRWHPNANGLLQLVARDASGNQATFWVEGTLRDIKPA